MPPAYASYVIGITIGQIMHDQLECPFLTYDEAIVDIEAAEERLREWFAGMLVRLRLQRALRADTCIPLVLEYALDHLLVCAPYNLGSDATREGRGQGPRPPLHLGHLGCQLQLLATLLLGCFEAQGEDGDHGLLHVT